MNQRKLSTLKVVSLFICFYGWRKLMKQIRPERLQNIRFCGEQGWHFLFLWGWVHYPLYNYIVLSSLFQIIWAAFITSGRVFLVTLLPVVLTEGIIRSKIYGVVSLFISFLKDSRANLKVEKRAPIPLGLPLVPLWEGKGELVMLWKSLIVIISSLKSDCPCVSIKQRAELCILFPKYQLLLVTFASASLNMLTFMTGTRLQITRAKMSFSSMKGMQMHIVLLLWLYICEFN